MSWVIRKDLLRAYQGSNYCKASVLKTNNSEKTLDSLDCSISFELVKLRIQLLKRVVCYYLVEDKTI